MPPEMIRPLTEYGILALGWVVSWVLWRRLVQMEDRLADAYQANTKAITELLTRLE